ncbi:MAG TPA: choice-of-anchor V domain-containing protein [Longimicrobiales bacterium]|nr:choice-of-anchor V domain-containing protein [Longimicrobiales bacterium]
MHVFRKLTLMVVASVPALAAFHLPSSSAGPQPAHTGAFGEPSCRACHYDYPLNESAVTIRLDSLPAMYQPAQSYRLRVRVRHPELRRAGFQLSARFEDGTQAGAFVTPDTALLRQQRARDVDYLSHNQKGADEVRGDSVSWSFDWIAPASDGRVVFSIAVNVANNDASEFGDRIFTAAFYSGAELVRK